MMEESAAGEGAGGREEHGRHDGGGASEDSPRRSPSAGSHQPSSSGRNRSILSSCRPPVVITADPPIPAMPRSSPQVPTVRARRSAAATRGLVSPWIGRSRRSSNSSHHPARATTASRGQHHHQHNPQRQHQTTAPVEVSPGEDADNLDGDGTPGRTGGDGSKDGCGMIQEATTASAAPKLEVDRNSDESRGRGRGRDTEQRRSLEDCEEGGREDGPSSSTRSFLLGSSSGGSGGGGRSSSSSSRRRSNLVTLEDLPDAALARAFFSGFLDSVEVASSLRLVSRRVMEIASAACQVMDLHRVSLGDQDLANLAAGFPRLVHVDLSFCKGLGEGIGTSLRPCHRTLRALSLRGVGVSSTVVGDLRHFPQLTFLDVSQSVARDSREVTPASLIEGLSGLERLKKLSLAWNKGVTDAVVEQLCVGVRGLVELDLGLCAQITARSIQALSAQKFLRVLSLRACVHVSDDVVKELVTACPRLSILDLAHLPCLTEKSLRALLLLRDLKKLDLRCCELLSTANVVAFRTSRPLTRVAELRALWP